LRYAPPMGRRPDPADYVPLKRDALFVLLALAGQPLHGYGIIRDVDARSEGEIVLQTGALYRTLRRLLSDHLIEECDRPAGAESDDERRRYYQPTPLGRAVLAAEVDRMARLVRAARLTADGKRPRLV
jgi:DNA-binding PadR family transcriptional regulator